LWDTGNHLPQEGKWEGGKTAVTGGTSGGVEGWFEKKEYLNGES